MKQTTVKDLKEKVKEKSLSEKKQLLEIELQKERAERVKKCIDFLKKERCVVDVTMIVKHGKLPQFNCEIVAI